MFKSMKLPSLTTAFPESAPLPAHSLPPDNGFDKFLIACAASVGMVGLATILALIVRRYSTTENLSLIFLTPVLVSAMRFGLWPSVIASVVGVLGWDYFFVAPYNSLQIGDPRDLLALIFFLVVALVISNLTALKIRQSLAIAAQARETAELYHFSQQIAAVSTLRGLLPVVAAKISTMLACRTVILLKGQDGFRLWPVYPADCVLGAEDLNAAYSCWSGNRPAGNSTGILQTAQYLYLPLATALGTVGIVGIDAPLQGILANRQRVSALLDQAAVAIERARLAESIGQAQLEAETERLRNAMLTSLSHDLRTPLTTIIAAHSTIKSMGQACDTATHSELLDRAQDEAERLDRFIGNLLDMTKLESGHLSATVQPTEVEEAIDLALTRAGNITAHHRIELHVDPDLPMANADMLLLEQAIFNLVDNATKYAPAGTAITISARAEPKHVAIDIADEGPGIPPYALEAIFDKFTRLKKEDRQSPGTGLGLAISRGFVTRMGGTISARNRQDRTGAVLTVRLQKAELPVGMNADGSPEAPDDPNARDLRTYVAATGALKASF